jgi:hypothetical protein
VSKPKIPWDVVCPKCGARPGNLCRTAGKTGSSVQADRFTRRDRPGLALAWLEAAALLRDGWNPGDPVTLKKGT